MFTMSTLCEPHDVKTVLMTYFFVDMQLHRTAASSRYVTLSNLKPSAFYQVRVYSSSDVANSSVVEETFNTPSSGK